MFVCVFVCVCACVCVCVCVCACHTVCKWVWPKKGACIILYVRCIEVGVVKFGPPPSHPYIRASTNGWASGGL